MKSQAEERIRDYLTGLDEQLEWQYEPAKIIMHVPLVYIPDFYIDPGIWLEVKSIARPDDLQRVLTFNQYVGNNVEASGIVYPVNKFIVVVTVSDSVLSSYDSWKDCKIVRYGSILREKQLVSWCRKNKVSVAVVSPSDTYQLHKRLFSKSKRRKRNVGVHAKLDSR